MSLARPLALASYTSEDSSIVIANASKFFFALLFAMLQFLFVLLILLTAVHASEGDFVFTIIPESTIFFSAAFLARSIHLGIDLRCACHISVLILLAPFLSSSGSDGCG